MLVTDRSLQCNLVCYASMVEVEVERRRGGDCDAGQTARRLAWIGSSDRSDRIALAVCVPPARGHANQACANS